MVVRLTKAEEHRRRVLEHQEKMRAGATDAASGAADPQLKMPLIGLAKPKGGASRGRAGTRARKVKQPELGEL